MRKLCGDVAMSMTLLEDPPTPRGHEWWFEKRGGERVLVRRQLVTSRSDVAFIDGRRAGKMNQCRRKVNPSSDAWIAPSLATTRTPHPPPPGSSARQPSLHGAPLIRRGRRPVRRGRRRTLARAGARRERDKPETDNPTRLVTRPRSYSSPDPVPSPPPPNPSSPGGGTEVGWAGGAARPPGRDRANARFAGGGESTSPGEPTPGWDRPEPGPSSCHRRRHRRRVSSSASEQTPRATPAWVRPAPARPSLRLVQSSVVPPTGAAGGSAEGLLPPRTSVGCSRPPSSRR